MLHSKPCQKPCSPTSLSPTVGTPLSDPHSYRSLIESLRYLNFTKPYFSFAVSRVCQFMTNPTDLHLHAAKRILRHLRGTLSSSLLFKPGPIQLSAYSDAAWAGDPSNRRSTTSFIVFMSSNPITWAAKKRSTVSRSSTEAEYQT